MSVCSFPTFGEKAMMFLIEFVDLVPPICDFVCDGFVLSVDETTMKARTLWNDFFVLLLPPLMYHDVVYGDVTQMIARE